MLQLHLLPIEIFDIIMKKTINYDNCNAMKLKLSNQYFNNNQILNSLQSSNNYCDYCKYIWRLWPQYPSVMRYPGILSENNEILCKNHIYKCKSCQKIFSYTYFNILFDKCYNCIRNESKIE